MLQLICYLWWIQKKREYIIQEIKNSIKINLKRERFVQILFFFLYLFKKCKALNMSISKQSMYVQKDICIKYSSSLEHTEKKIITFHRNNIKKR